LKIDPKKPSEFTKKEIAGALISLLVGIIVLGSIVIPVMVDGVREAEKRKCRQHFNTTEYEFQGVADGPSECCYEGECFQPMINVGAPPNNFLPLAIGIALFVGVIALIRPEPEKEADKK